LNYWPGSLLQTVRNRVNIEIYGKYRGKISKFGI